MLALATKVVSKYGHVLGSLPANPMGMPESSLPYSKAQIREALVFLLGQVAPSEVDIREGLKRGYVYLAQFMPDRELASVVAANDPFAPMRAMSKVKLAMERALDEVSRL
jgi:hypothetical protein